MTPAELIAAAIEDACDVDGVASWRPVHLEARTAFVEPAQDWKQRDDSYCGLSIGLDVYLVAGSTDPRGAQAWLDEQSTVVMNIPPIDIGSDTVFADSVDRPVLFVQDGGKASFFACRINLTRFTPEES